MSYLKQKLTTAKRVAQSRGLLGVVSEISKKVNDQLQPLLAQTRSEAAPRDFKHRLDKVLRASSITTPHKMFGKLDDDFWFWMNTEGYRESPMLREVLPSMPDEDTQHRFTGAAGDRTMAEGFRNYKLFKQIAEEHLGGIAACHNILDFGCGWGRVIRFFLKDVEPTKLWGIDCLSGVLDISRSTNEWCNFKLVDPMPPTDFPDKMFDLIYSFSVFSHLSEDAHEKWLMEFHRILRPGGVLIATTRSREFIEYCGELGKQENLPSYQIGEAAAFSDTQKWLADYDNGEYCYYPMGGGDILDSSFFGQTCIPKKYALKHWTERFTFLDYITDSNRCEQNVIIVKK